MKLSAKIIMLTDDGTVVVEAEKIGVKLYLEKLISIKRLFESVYTIINLKLTSTIINP